MTFYPKYKTQHFKEMHLQVSPMLSMCLAVNHHPLYDSSYLLIPTLWLYGNNADMPVTKHIIPW